MLFFAGALQGMSTPASRIDARVFFKVIAQHDHYIQIRLSDGKLLCLNRIVDKELRVYKGIVFSDWQGDYWRSSSVILGGEEAQRLWDEVVAHFRITSKE